MIREKTQFVLITLIIGFLSACEGGGVGTRMEDGYQVGDITAGAVQDVRMYCSAEFQAARAAGRLAAGLVGYPVPDVCMEIWRRLYAEMGQVTPTENE